MYLLCPQRFSSENFVALGYISWWVFFCTTWISESFKVSDQFRWNSDSQTASRYRLLRIALHCTVMTSQKNFCSWSQKSSFAWRAPSVTGKSQMKAYFELCSLTIIIYSWIPCSPLASNSTKLHWRSIDSAKKTLELILINVTVAIYPSYLYSSLKLYCGTSYSDKNLSQAYCMIILHFL